MPPARAGPQQPRGRALSQEDGPSPFARTLSDTSAPSPPPSSCRSGLPRLTLFHAIARQVYALSHSTLPQAPFTRPSLLNEPIILPLPHLALSSPDLADASLTIHPGDFLLADEDGVVVIPKDLIDDVIREAGARREIDDLCAKDLKAGKGVAETFKLRRK